MKVQRIQNNNTSFKAKLNINNKSCYGIPKEIIAEMSSIAKRIGTNKDTITIEIGKYKSFSDSWSEMGHRYTMTTRTQEIIANSNINGSKDIKDISYTTNIDDYPGDLAARRIFTYLYKLVNCKK